jgi:hypothetical protein
VRQSVTRNGLVDGGENREKSVFREAHLKNGCWDNIPQNWTVSVGLQLSFSYCAPDGTRVGELYTGLFSGEEPIRAGDSFDIGNLYVFVLGFYLL